MLSDKSQPSPFMFAIVLLPKFSLLTLSTLVEPLRIANLCAGKTLYDWCFLSPDGTDVVSSEGTTVPTRSVSIDVSYLDAIIINGGWNANCYDNPDLRRWLRLMGRRDIILGAAEMGAYVLARAGLLSGYTATIHWSSHSSFQETYSGTTLIEKRYVIDRKRMTCSGGTACLEMMLHDISSRFGNSLALEVADQINFSPSFAASTPSKEVDIRKKSILPSILEDALIVMERNTEDPLKIPELCQSLNISQRKLERLFHKHFFCSVVTLYRRVRLKHARALLTQTEMTVMEVCVACGFTSSSYFSKSYTEYFGICPRDHRTAWPDNSAAPL